MSGECAIFAASSTLHNAQMNKDHLRHLIAQNRLEVAIHSLLALTQNTHLHDEALAQSSRYNQYKTLETRGSEPTDDLNRMRANITHALLSLVEQLPESAALDASSDAAAPVDTPSPMTISAFYFSIVALGVLLALSVLVPDWTQRNNAFFKTLLALASAGVVTTLPGFLHFDLNNIVKTGGALAAFVLVYLINPAKEDKPFTFTVYMQDDKGQIIWLAPEAEIIIDFPSGRKIANTNIQGEAEFRGIASADIEKPLRISLLKSSPYVLVQPDSIFDLRGKTAIYLPVKTEGLDKIRGTVQDSGGQFIADAIILVEGIADTSDALGRFEVHIPADKEKTRYRLLITKPGYAAWENYFSPSEEQEAPVVLQILKK